MWIVQSRWLQDIQDRGLQDAIEAFESIAAASKAFILKGARAVSSRKPFDGSEMFASLTEAWEKGTRTLRARLQLRIAAVNAALGL